MKISEDLDIQRIPIKHITVLNPRDRGKRKFGRIINNIAVLGLKKPVTVAHVDGTNGNANYLLVCGQGRLEAYIALGEEEIPAIVVRGSKEELLLMSLAENLARRQHSVTELVREISALKDRGHTVADIAKKTDLDVTYIRGIMQLLAKGEKQLLNAVEKGQIPVSIAVTIATADDKAIQKALTEAYERNDLRGKRLLSARRLIEARRAKIAKTRRAPGSETSKVSTDMLLRAYREETIRQKILVDRAKMCDARLRFAVTAIRQLFQEPDFKALVRTEGLDEVPQYLAEQVKKLGADHESQGTAGL